jgi:hypothetical protein
LFLGFFVFSRFPDPRCGFLRRTSKNIFYYTSF